MKEEPTPVEAVNYSTCAVIDRKKKNENESSYVKTLNKVKQISYQKENQSVE